MSNRGILFVHPHPDDESIACGGAIMRSLLAGHRTHVVTCTGGEAGENLSGIDMGDEDLAAHRRREMQDALLVLGSPTHHWLGYRDSGMVGSPENDNPESFHAADLDEAAARLASIIREARPDVVVSDDENGTYGHPDHVKANRVTARAVELAADPTFSGGEPWEVARYLHFTLTRSRLWATHQAMSAAGASPFGEPASIDELAFGAPDDDVAVKLDVVDLLPRKQEAMRAHRTQVGEDSFFLSLDGDGAAAFFGLEEFVVAHGSPVSDATDLFAGLT